MESLLERGSICRVSLDVRADFGSFRDVLENMWQGKAQGNQAFWPKLNMYLGRLPVNR